MQNNVLCGYLYIKAFIAHPLKPQRKCYRNVTRISSHSLEKNMILLKKNVYLKGAESNIKLIREHS